jgi:hypothetical protein
MYWEDVAVEEENREYEAAKCKEPHTDGTSCLPSWDGYGFVCVKQVLATK